MKKIAFFDLDGTLVTCQTQQQLARVLRTQRILSERQAAEIFLWFVLYKIGLVRESIQIRRRVYKVFALRSKEEVDNLIKLTFEQYIKPEINKSLSSYLVKHKQNGDLLICVSGTLNNFCQLVCQELAINEYHGTELKIVNGCYTGEWENEILEGEAKAIFVRKLTERRGFKLEDCYAYCDSTTDEPLLEIVGHPVVVSGDKKLLTKAVTRNWQVIEKQ